MFLYIVDYFISDPYTCMESIFFNYNYFIINYDVANTFINLQEAQGMK